MNARMHVCTHTCTHARMHACTHACPLAHAHTPAHTHAHTNARRSARTCTHAHACTRMCTHAHACARTHIHTHTCTYTRTHAQAHMPARAQACGCAHPGSQTGGNKGGNGRREGNAPNFAWHKKPLAPFEQLSRLQSHSRAALVINFCDICQLLQGWEKFKKRLANGTKFVLLGDMTQDRGILSANWPGTNGQWFDIHENLANCFTLKVGTRVLRDFLGDPRLVCLRHVHSLLSWAGGQNFDHIFLQVLWITGQQAFTAHPKILSLPLGVLRPTRLKGFLRQGAIGGLPPSEELRTHLLADTVRYKGPLRQVAWRQALKAMHGKIFRIPRVPKLPLWIPLCG